METIRQERARPVAPSDDGLLRLAGVDHTARPTWKLGETVRFYRDVLGLPLVHAVSARGWGPSSHPDFVHFFFESGNGSTIAFFYYAAQPVPPEAERPVMRPWPEDHVFDATHTAWLVATPEELGRWKERLQDRGVDVSTETAHEVIESIYFRDPNGYFLEITRKLRCLEEVDRHDAAATIEAAISLEEAAARRGERIAGIDGVWQEKGARLADQLGVAPANDIILFVPDVAEFKSAVVCAQGRPSCTVTGPRLGYYVIRSPTPVAFSRRELGLRPAVWYGLPTGGMIGAIQRFDRDDLVIGALARDAPP
jgi:catechol 2,3-dioxygenase-like lactoylglutathione lyase family enzyme